MTKLIIAILTAGKKSGGFLLDQSDDIYAHFQIVVRIIVALITIGFSLNWIGLGMINVFLGLFFGLSVFLGGIYPRIIIGIAGGGAIIEKMRESDRLAIGAEDFLKGYAELLVTIMLYGMVIFLALGTIPFGENPVAFWIILSAVIIRHLIVIKRNADGNFGGGIIRLITTATIIACLYSLVPAHTWVKLTGYNLKTPLEASESEKALLNYEEVVSKVADEDLATEVNKLTDKLNDGKELNDKEKSVIEEARKKRASSSIPHKTVLVAKKVREKTKELFPESTSNPDGQKWTEMQTFTFIPKYWDEIKKTSFFPAATLGPGTYQVDASGISKVALSSGRLVSVPPKGGMVTHNEAYNKGIILPAENQAMLIGRIVGIPGMNDPFPIGEHYLLTVPEGALAVLYLTANLNERWGSTPSKWSLSFINNKGPGWEIKISKLQES